MAKIGKPVVYKVTTTKKDPTTGRKLKPVESKRYYIEIRVDGKNKKCPGHKDKRSTQSLANRLYDYLAQLAESEERDSLRTKSLTELCDEMEAPAEEPLLTEQLVAFKQFLLDDNGDPEWVKTKEKRVRDVIEGCGWRYAREMRPSDVVGFTAALREKKLSQATVNHYVGAVKHFAAWLEQDGRIERSPLARLEMPETDESGLRHVRRVLTVEQFAKLLRTARESQSVVLRLSGIDRMMLYAMAAYTGFRAAELSSLTPQSLVLSGEVPTATVEAGYTKNGKRATSPLNAELVRLLLPWLEARPTDKPLWPGRTWFQQGARMLRVYLKAAEIPYRDARGHVFDFHALRRQFITNLALAGVHPAVAQVLARHSKPELTLNVYTKLDLTPQTDAVNRLPQLPA